MSNGAQPISFLIGRPHGKETTAVASVIFPKEHWTRAQAVRWLERNGFKSSPLETLRSGVRAVQHRAGFFKPKSLRIIHTAGHAEAVSNPRGGARKLVVPQREYRQAINLYRKFQEREPQKIRVAQFKMPRMLMNVGPAVAVEYLAVYRGRQKLYRHRFAPHAMPTLAASHDGRQVYLIGGQYDFTRDGIVDAP